jgi:nucleoid DNA-binding protein
MKRDELARQIARQTRTSPAEAADRLDRVIHDLIQKMKKGKRTALPGLGELAPGQKSAGSKRERA